jgi:hypothetical protein
MLEPTRRELAHRSVDSLEVFLYWLPEAELVSVVVLDERNDEAFELVVEPERALDAFYHPFPFAAARGVEYRTSVREHDQAVYV